MKDFTVMVGDCRETLRTLPDASVHCCVTSPPYHNLRRYGDGSQRHVEIGAESSVEEHIAALVEVFREVRRVLHPSGLVFINYGFSFAGSGRGGNPPDSPHQKQATNRGCVIGQTARDAANTNGPGDDRTPPGFKPKDCIPLPWMLTLAMIADGWWFRCPIVWHKPSAMPSSQTDRPTLDFEHVLMFAKSARYFYDDFAVRVKASTTPHAPGYTSGAEYAVGPMDRGGHSQREQPDRVWSAGGTRSLRSVWTIAAEPTKFNHFAAFPRKLVEPCIKAGTSEKGCCPECFAPWQRVVERERVPTRPGHDPKDGDNGYANRDPLRHCTETRTAGWARTCDHEHDPIPCTVLDVFCGTGRTGAVAVAHGRKFIGCELYENYAEYARQYIANPDPMPVEPDVEGQNLLFSEGQ